MIELSNAIVGLAVAGGCASIIEGVKYIANQKISKSQHKDPHK